MKKRFLTIAIAAGMAASFAANADVTVFGNVHVSWDDKDDDTAAQPAPTFNSNTSTIGVKGKEDLGAGMTALYFLEWQVDVMNQGGGKNNAPSGTSEALVDRNQWVGIKSGMGTLKIGTVTSNYKATGSKVDPLWRTQLEARASGGMSNLHGGAAIDRGRMTNAFQYHSPKMGGMQLVLNGTVTDSDTDSETLGIGFRYATKNLLAFVDTITVTTGTGTDETATKVGATYKMDGMKFAGQFESADDLKTEDYMFLAGTFDVNKNDSVSVTFASNEARSSTVGNDGSGYAVLYNHKMSKRTNVYAGYGSEDFDDNNTDDTNMTVGLRHKF